VKEFHLLLGRTVVLISRIIMVYSSADSLKLARWAMENGGHRRNQNQGRHSPRIPDRETISRSKAAAHLTDIGLPALPTFPGKKLQRFGLLFFLKFSPWQRLGLAPLCRTVNRAGLG